MKFCTVHPDKPAKARGLCRNCYMREYIPWRNAQIEAGTWKTTPKPCACGKPAVSLGMCRLCYADHYNRTVRRKAPKTPREWAVRCESLERDFLALQAELEALRGLVWGES